MMTDNKQKNIIKLWQICLVFLFWIGAMFLPATINQIKFGTNFDLAKSRENYFFYLWVQKPMTSTLLILLLLWIILSCLRKWKITPFLSFSFMLLYIYDLFLEFVLGRIFVGVSLKLALSPETFIGLWRTLGLGFFLTSLLGSCFSILLFVYLMNLSSLQKS